MWFQGVCKTMVLASWASFVLLFPCAGSLAENNEGPTDKEYSATMKPRLKSIDASDGIDKNEAQLIFELYGFRYFHYNGWGDLDRDGTFWYGTVLSHWGNKPLEHQVRIHSRTGAISWERGPNISNFRTLLDDHPR